MTTNIGNKKPIQKNCIFFHGDKKTPSLFQLAKKIKNSHASYTFSNFNTVLKPKTTSFTSISKKDRIS